MTIKCAIGGETQCCSSSLHAMNVHAKSQHTFEKCLHIRLKQLIFWLSVTYMQFLSRNIAYNYFCLLFP
jgi:hypothetical protein